jgi:hypothetical protein
LQADFQHVAWRSIDNKYQDAPKTYKITGLISIKHHQMTKNNNRSISREKQVASKGMYALI